MKIDFGPWLPDLPEYENPGCITATNVIPRLRGFNPIRDLVAVTGKLTNRCQGAAPAKSLADDSSVFAGDVDKLYELEESTQFWLDRSKVGGYATTSTGLWQFANFGDTFIATNFTDPIQFKTLDTVNLFADLITSTRKPKAKAITVVRDFVVLGFTDDTVDGSQSQRIWWSAINDPTDFDPAAATQCDFQDLRSPYGVVQRIVGGEYGRVYQEAGIQRMTFRGPPTIFEFDEVERRRGLFAPNALISVGALDYFLSADGFYTFDGTRARPIGKEKVDSTFFNDLAVGNKHLISAGLCNTTQCVWWIYPSNQATENTCDKIIHYHWPTEMWSVSEIDTEFLFTSLTSDTTLEALDSLYPDLESVPGSLDDPQWVGGTSVLYAFDPLHQAGSFTGSFLTARIDTREQQVSGGPGKYMTRHIRPLVQGAGTSTITVQVGHRDDLSQAKTFDGAKSLLSNGQAFSRRNARYHTFRLNISGGFQQAQGVELIGGGAVGTR